MELTTAVALLLALAGPLAIAAFSERAPLGPYRLLWFLVAQGALFGLVVLIAAFAVFGQGLSWHSLGLANPGLMSVVLGLALAAFFIYGYGPAVYWALSKLNVRGFEKGLAKLAGLPVWALIVAVLVDGIAEEFLYRAYAFERIAAITGSLWLAGTVPLLLFALAHVPMWGRVPALSVLVSGAILTIWYAWHRDLTANVIAHCVTDLFGLVIGPLAQGRGARGDDA